MHRVPKTAHVPRLGEKRRGKRDFHLLHTIDVILEVHAVVFTLVIVLTENGEEAISQGAINHLFLCLPIQYR
jgi:hypothetical protein